MQYNASTPGAYLEQLEDDWRKDKLMQVRAFIQAQGPHLKEGIEYKMLCYGDGEKNLFHLNAQRAYVSLYVGDISKVPEADTLLEEFDQGKGCIRIKKKNSLRGSGLETFIQNAIAHHQAGGDTDC